jgi:hypothetical protein
VTLQSYGYANPSRLVSHEIASPDRDETFADRLDAVVERTCAAEAAGKINIVGVDYPWLNGNTLGMLAFSRFAERGRRCYYTSLGYAQADPEAAWSRVQEFQPPYYVGIDYGNARNPLPPPYADVAARGSAFNRVNQDVFERVTRSSEFDVVPGTRRAGLVVFRALDRG